MASTIALTGHLVDAVQQAQQVQDLPGWYNRTEVVLVPRGPAVRRL